MSTKFKRLCKSCEQIETHERKNVDRPRWILEKRAASRASELGVSKEYVWQRLTWFALVPYMRAMMTTEGRCLSCGHAFDNERDIHIEHLEPPRADRYPDFAREHARNLRFACQNCNCTKGRKSFAEWLDDMEDARVSNEHQRAGIPVAPEQKAVQNRLFEDVFFKDK